MLLGGSYILYRFLKEDTSGRTVKAIVLLVGFVAVWGIVGAIAESSDGLTAAVIWIFFAGALGYAYYYFFYLYPKGLTKAQKKEEEERNEYYRQIVLRNRREYASVQARLDAGITEDELVKLMKDCQVVTRVTRDNAVEFLELLKKHGIQRGEYKIDPKWDAQYYLGKNNSCVFYVTTYTFFPVHSIRAAPSAEEIWMDHFRTCNVCDFERVIHPDNTPDLTVPDTGMNLDNM